MKTNGIRVFWVGAAIAVAGVLPILVYWFLFESVSAVTPDEAKAMLVQTNAQVRLVDVRSRADFAASHLPGAVNWPMKESDLTVLPTDWIPADKDTTVLILCQSGLMSARAARALQRGALAPIHDRVFRVAGGMSAWSTFSGGKCIAANARQMSPALQWLAAITGFGIKPLYMLLVLLWIIWLWRRAEPDLAALRWGLIIFWLGENACSINYLFFRGLSDLWEFLHNYGMAVGFSFMAWSIIEWVDHRLFKLSLPRDRCAVLSLCKTCIKHAPVSCKAQQIFKWLLPAAIAVASLPLFAEIKVESYNAGVLGGIENYSLMASSQLFENRYCSLLAIVLLAASWAVMLLKKNDPIPLAKVLFAAALGPLSFGFMRLFLSGAFSENLLWYVVWEEWTELIFVVAIGVVLWLFRHSLMAGAIRDEPGTRTVVAPG